MKIFIPFFLNKFPLRNHKIAQRFSLGFLTVIFQEFFLRGHKIFFWKVKMKNNLTSLTGFL